MLAMVSLDVARLDWSRPTRKTDVRGKVPISAQQGQKCKSPKQGDTKGSRSGLDTDLSTRLDDHARANHDTCCEPLVSPVVKFQTSLLSNFRLA